MVFGQDLVFGSLMKELKYFELNVVTFPDGQFCKGTLYAIAGDNLGSRNSGCFTDNFSKSTYFCRY